MYMDEHRVTPLLPDKTVDSAWWRQKKVWVSAAMLAALVVAVVSWWLLKSPPPGPSSQEIPSGQQAKASLYKGSYVGDLTSETTLENIAISSLGAQGIDIDPKTGQVYIGAFAGLSNKCLNQPGLSGGTLSVVDPAQKKEIASVTTDGAPIWPAVGASRNKVYVAASTGSVAVHELGTGKKLSSINLGGLPHMPAILGNIMVVSNTYNQSQTYYSAINLDTEKELGHYTGPKLPHPIVIDEKLKRAYMMGVEDAGIVAIDMTTGQPIETFKLEGGRGQLALWEEQNLAVTDASSGGASLSLFDWNARRLSQSIGFEGANSPGTVLAIDQTSGLLFVIVSDNNAVGVVSLKDRKPIGYFKVGACPYAVRLDETRGKGYVTNTGDKTITMFDLAALRAKLGN